MKANYHLKKNTLETLIHHIVKNDKRTDVTVIILYQNKHCLVIAL